MYKCRLGDFYYNLILFKSFHGGEEQNISDTCGVRQQHNQTVNAITNTACGGHTDFQSIQEVFIGMVGFFVTLCQQLFLLGKTLPRVTGVIQLGLGVAHLAAIDKQLKTLHIIRLIGLTLGQRRNFHRMVHNEHRLD